MIIKINKNNHFLFYSLLSVLIVLLFARYAFLINIPRIVLTVIVFAIAICGNKNEVIAIAMCCLPLHNAINLYMAISVCAFMYVIKENKRIKLGAIAAVIVSMILWEILHCFDSNFSLKLLFVTISPMLLLMVVSGSDMRSLDYSFIVRTMAIVNIIVCVVLFLNLLVSANYSFADALISIRRLGIVTEDSAVFGATINPNALGIINILTMIALLQLRSSGQGSALDFCFTLILLVFGFLTASRTFLVCLCVMAILLFLAQRGSAQKKLQFVVAFTVLVILLFIVLFYLFPEQLVYYINRFKNGNVTNGRDMLMSVYHNYIVHNNRVLFFGIGLNDFETKVTRIYNISNAVPHNFIQEIVLAWGIVGVILVVCLNITMVIRSINCNKKQSLLNFIPLLIILLKSMAGQFLTSGYTMLALSFAYLSLCQNFDRSDMHLEENPDKVSK